MSVKFTAANLRTIAQYGEADCLRALFQNEVRGEGANTVGGGDTRLGDNLINAGRKLAARINAQAVR
jgi:hypothetical protein